MLLLLLMPLRRSMLDSSAVIGCNLRFIGFLPPPCVVSPAVVVVVMLVALLSGRFTVGV